jgi:type IV pilus assembly protein PilW
MKMPINYKKGFSLIEIMIALTLSSVIIAGVAQVYLSTKRTYSTTSELSGLQENGRFAMLFLNKDIRMGGFQGCGNGANITPVNNVDIDGDNVADDISDKFDNTSIVSGSDNVVANTTIGADTIITGTDTIRVQFGGACGGNLLSNMSNFDSDIKISNDNSCNLTPGQIFMITNCIRTDIAAVTTAPIGASETSITHATALNIDNRLSYAYLNDASIYSIQSYTFFIANNANNQPALMRRNNGASLTEELVEGVENMQILYGEDTDGNEVADYYVVASSVVDMSKIIGIKISLLLSTREQVASQLLSYHYNGIDITASDRKIRKVFSTTIALRNRLR